MFPTWNLRALPPSFLLQVLITVQIPFATATCSQELALVGYPSCASLYFSICDKYCPSVLSDATCTCRTSAYIQDAFACLKKACSRSDLLSIASTVEPICKSYGYDISQYITISSSSADTSPISTPPSASSGASTAAANPSGGSGGRGGGGVPVGTVVGIALGIGLPLVIAIGVILYCMRRRKRRSAQSSAVEQVPLKQEGTFQAPLPPQPQSQPQPQPLPVYTPPIQYQEMGTVQGAGWHAHAPTEIEGKALGNAPGWRAPHEMDDWNLTTGVLRVYVTIRYASVRFPLSKCAHHPPAHCRKEDGFSMMLRRASISAKNDVRSLEGSLTGM